MLLYFIPPYHMRLITSLKRVHYGYFYTIINEACLTCIEHA